MTRVAGFIPASRQTSISDTANDARSARQARPPETVFESRRPRNELMTKPANGNSGISESTRSPLQQRKGFGVERLAMAEQPDDQRQANRRLGGRDGDDEERDDLAVGRAELPPERHEGQVDGVQHDLDR